MNDVVMTQVSLSVFTFALPTVISIDTDAQDGLCAKTDLPQEFFGLPAKEQLAVINSVLCAAAKYVHHLDQSIEQSECARDTRGIVSLDIDLPLLIGIGLKVKKIPDLHVESNFTFPERWNVMSEHAKKRVMNSIAFLMQTVGISIVNREQKYRQSTSDNNETTGCE